MKMEFVKVGVDAAGSPFVMRADLPVGRGFNEKGLPQEYINLGWEPAVVYDARINSEKAEAKRAALITPKEDETKSEITPKGKK